MKLLAQGKGKAMYGLLQVGEGWFGVVVQDYLVTSNTALQKVYELVQYTRGGAVD